MHACVYLYIHSPVYVLFAQRSKSDVEETGKESTVLLATVVLFHQVDILQFTKSFLCYWAFDCL